MKRIMFVCHGNICRSPMAEFIFKKMIAESEADLHFYVASSATSTEEIWGDIGNPVYPPARAKLAEHGIGCAGKTARQLTKADYNYYDLLIGMDSANIRNMNRICGGDPDGKIRLLLDYIGENRDVADPWYTRNFEATWQDAVAGCTALFNQLW